MPENSCIVETKCAEITVSENFAIGLTLRFPRARKIRYDKEISGVMTSTQFKDAQDRDRTMNSSSSSGISSKNDDFESQQKKRNRGTAEVSNGESSRKRSAAPSGASYIVDMAENSKLIKEKDVFEGKLFCVLENTFNIPDGLFIGITPRSFNAKDFAALICKYGGTVIANPMEDSLVVCGNKRTIPIQNIITSKKRDVIMFTYILECVEASTLLPTKTRHFIGMCSGRADDLASRSDLFGDSFTEDVSSNDIHQLFQDMDFAVAAFRGSGNAANSRMQIPLAMIDLTKHSEYQNTLLYYKQLSSVG